ncbi:MAG: hypothetical protein CO079_05350 [Nitrosopumilales archaeon CG_4_9_14_0_8_um_filter_34_10]|nr:MAG: hypothetical protein CO079_05350 [Nitrosopumilales archaeon CG_4_9_14_0_8_um_filter_34_10]
MKKLNIVIIICIGIAIIMVASVSFQNYYLFDPNFTDKPSGVSIQGLGEEYRQGEPIEFAINVHGFSVGCESVTVKIFNEWEAEPPLLYEKEFVAEGKPYLKPSQTDYSCPIMLKEFNDDKPGKYLVMVNYFQDRGSFGEIKQYFTVSP